MPSTAKPSPHNELTKWRRWLGSNTQELGVIGVILLALIVLYTSSELWRYYVLTNGLTSVATIQEVRSKDIVIAYKAGTQLHRVTLSQPYPELSVSQRFEMRYNKYWHNDAVVLFWKPLLHTATPTLIHPNRVTEVPLTRGNVVEAEYTIEGKQLTSYLCLPPDFNMHKLQNIILTYDAQHPGIAYYLPSAAQ